MAYESAPVTPGPTVGPQDQPDIYTPPPQSAADVLGGVPNMPPAQYITPGMDGPPDPEIVAAAVHHGRLASGMNTVADILTGGGKKWTLRANADGSVDAEPTPMSGKEKWGRIAAAAISGAARGFAVGQGPGGMGRAAGAGFESGLQMGQQPKQEAYAEADRATKLNRDRMLFTANMNKLNQDAVKSTWELHNLQATAQEGEETAQAARQEHFEALHAKHVHLDSGGDANELMERVAQTYNTDPEMKQALHDRRLRVFTSYDRKTGQVNGADIYAVPEDKMKALNDKPYQRTKLVFDEANPEKPLKRVNMGDPIPAGYMPNEQLDALRQTDTNNDNTTQEQWLRYNGIAAQSKMAMATLKATQAATAAANKETFQPMEVEDPKNPGHSVIRAVGNKGTVKPYSGLDDGYMVMKPGQDTKNKLQFDKTYLLPARDSERTKDLADLAYSDYKKGTKTGAASMVELANHIQNTFGMGKGARQTTHMIEQHLHARSVTDDMTVAFNKFMNGDELSPDQWKDFNKLIHEARNENWRKASDAALYLHYSPDEFLPEKLKGSAVSRGYRGTQQVITPPMAAPAAPTGGTSNDPWASLPVAQ